MLTTAAAGCVKTEETTGSGGGGASSTSTNDGGAGGTTTNVGGAGGAGGGSTNTGGAGGAGGTSTSTNTGGAGGVGGGTTSTSGTNTANDAEIKFYGEGAKEIPKGDEYKQTNLDGIPPFSSGIARITIANAGGAALTIKNVEVTPLGDTREGEWAESKPGSTNYTPFELKDTTLQAGESAETGLFFQPYASGDRSMRITVHTTDGKQAWFDVYGRGRDNLVLSTKVTSKLERVWSGNNKSQFRPGGAVSDGADGVVLSGNVDELLDGFNPDLVLSRVSADGSQAWAKTWHESYHQKVPEPNKETGGSADAIATDSDGFVYVGASRSVDSANSEPAAFQALVYKVKASDGTMAWARGIRNGTKPTPENPENVAWRGAMGYAIDASLSDRVVVTGYTGSPPKMLLAALKKTDGSMIYSRILDVDAKGAANNGYTIRIGADGAGYVGGNGDGRAVLARFTALDTDDPQLAWVEKIGTGIGSRVQSIELTDSGDALAALFIGGANRSFVGMRIKTDGTKAWAKTWDGGNSGGNNNAWVVRRKGTTAFFGGNIAAAAADTTGGDGFLLGLDTETGAYKVGSMYYTGKTTTTIAKHAIKGIVFAGSDLFSVFDATTVQNNTNHYWGFWYQPPTEKLDLPLEGKDGSERLADFVAVSPVKVDVSTFTRLQELNDGTLGGAGYEATSFEIDTADIWKDVPTDMVDFQDPHGYDRNPINHFLVTKVTVED
jgi:hypothetical protein